ncbi:MAG: hypothetical protein KatS3mg124_0050 [Porticoccaceae bacterium]|nr:MAG: hypothetical protein KatS3mg124_0050 [Porticoccaceae bacterium]
MAERSRLARRVAALEELGGLLEAMKNLAGAEAQRLQHIALASAASLAELEEAAAAFAGAFPDLVPAPRPPRLHLAVGSERGFCGPLNHQLVAALAEEGEVPLVVVGRRLARLLAGEARLALALPGPVVAEEIASCVDEIAAALFRLGPMEAGETLLCTHYDGAGRLRRTRLWPAFPATAAPAAWPILQLDPQDLALALARTRLEAALEGVLAESLAHEERARARHLEQAVERLAERAETLRRRLHRLRQEEIIEEIEVILLSSRAGAAGG